MRLESYKDGNQHPSINTPNDHHPAPESIEIENTTQSLPPGTTYNLDISLSHSNYQIARIQLMGPNYAPGVYSPFKECAEIVATRDSSEAMGHSIRNADSMKKSYSVTYSKQNSDAYLSHAIFDSVIGSGSSNRRIALQDVVIINDVLRLTFKNFFGGSSYLWVKGQALLY